MKYVSILLSTLFLLICQISHAQNKTIDLKGQWRFQIDRSDIGEKEKWFSKKLNDNIYLPGSMTENHKGDDVTLTTQWTASIYDSSFFFNPRL
ncbi:hypothetical protein, partial [Dysgonomonas gadei]